jgi:hypothetical protein
VAMAMASSDVKITILNGGPPSRWDSFFTREAPEEVALHLTGYLDAKSLCQLSMTNKKMKDVTSNRKLWNERLKGDFKEIKENRTNTLAHAHAAPLCTRVQR